MKLVRIAKSVLQRIAAKRARRRQRVKSVPVQPRKTLAKELMDTFHNPMRLKTVPPERIGVTNARVRLADHRAKFAKTPKPTTVSRQYRRQMERRAAKAAR